MAAAPLQSVLPLRRAVRSEIVLRLCTATIRNATVTVAQKNCEQCAQQQQQVHLRTPNNHLAAAAATRMHVSEVSGLNSETALAV